MQEKTEQFRLYLNCSVLMKESTKRIFLFLMKSFTLFTIKSKQVWMKSSLHSDEIKSVFYPCEARFHHEVISSALADLFRRKTDLVEKRLFRRIVFFLEEPNGLDDNYKFNIIIVLRKQNLKLVKYFGQIKE